MKSKVLFIIYNGVVFSLLANLLLARFVFICMYVDFKILFPAMWIVGIGIFYLFEKKYPNKRIRTTVVNLCGSFSILVFIYNFIYNHNLASKAGFIVRLAIHNQEISNLQINIAIMLLLGIGFFGVLLTEKNKYKK